MQCSKRYAKSNNKYVKDYDPEQRESYIMYFHANNLCRWAMSNPLPFKMVTAGEIIAKPSFQRVTIFGLMYYFEHNDNNQNIYDAIRDDCAAHFGTSDYPLSNSFNIPPVSKKVLGLLKYEACSTVISEFVGLRAKMYSIRFSDKTPDIKKAKSIGQMRVPCITFDTYKDTLFEKQTLMSKFNNIVTKNHSCYKLSLNYTDDKRQVMGDNTLPWRYHQLY